LNKAIITSKQAAGCLLILRRAAQPVTAANIAMRLQLPGVRETQRRRVRAIVKQLRSGGAMIVGSISQGYWLTEDIGLWREYLEHRNIDAKRILADAYRKKRAIDYAGGQGFLFEQKILAGCATIATG